MFDAVTIPWAQHLDLGRLAECLVFYGKTHLQLPPFGIASLIEQVDPECLVDLLAEGVIGFESSPWLAVMPGGVGPSQPYDVAFALISDNKPRNGADAKYATVPEQVETALRRRGLSRFKISPLTRKLVAGIADVPNSLPVDVRACLVRPEISSVVSELLRLRVPQWSPPGGFSYQVSPGERGLVVTTDIPLAAPDGSPFPTPASIFTELTGALNHLSFAGRNGAELRVGPRESEVVRAVTTGAILSAERSRETELAQFQHVQFDTLDVRSAVNSGRHQFRDVVDLVGKARKYKTWVAGQPPTKELLQAYTAELQRVSMWQTEEWHAFEWLFLTTGLGTLLSHPQVPTAISVPVLSFFALLLREMKREWRPNQFVDGPLRTFVEPR